MSLPAPLIRPIFPHGLVVGKFFPPHRGHAFLLRSAAQFCNKVTVGVFDHPSDTLPLALRAEALAEMAAPFPNLRFVWAEDRVAIDYNSVEVWDQHTEIFRRAIANALACEGTSIEAQPVNAVFTSEVYGDELARRFASVHVQVDKGREWEPISGTVIRSDPAAHWWSMPAMVRARLAKRIVILGAESTGTTTLAQDLTGRLRTLGSPYTQTMLVPEYGREYTIQKLAVNRAQVGTGAGMENLTWPEDEFVHIASMQTQLEMNAAGMGGPAVVCDTDAVATAVWHERYRQCHSAAVDGVIGTLSGHRLYLLTHHEGVPFVNDGMRDGEHLRSWMTERFENMLKERAANYVVLRGSKKERLDLAAEAAATFMAQPQVWT